MFSEFELIERFPFSDSDPLLVDVGAHHGHISRQFAAKHWKVVAFEPEKENWAALVRNTSDYEGIVRINKAVSSVSGDRVPFYVSNEHFGIHSLKPFHETHSFDYEVETITLDDALTQQEIHNITLLKIDIEGADFLALKGLNLEKFQPQLVMLEFMDERSKRNFGYTHHDVVQYMKEAGYICMVSEWAPVQEYAREGEVSDPHSWLRCEKYPLDSTPNWGNLIFVPVDLEASLETTLRSYLQSIRVRKRHERIRSIAKTVPGAIALYRFLKDR